MNLIDAGHPSSTGPPERAAPVKTHPWPLISRFRSSLHQTTVAVPPGRQRWQHPPKRIIPSTNNRRSSTGPPEMAAPAKAHHPFNRQPSQFHRAARDGSTRQSASSLHQTTIAVPPARQRWQHPSKRPSPPSSPQINRFQSSVQQTTTVERDDVTDAQTIDIKRCLSRLMDRFFHLPWPEDENEEENEEENKVLVGLLGPS